ncbi:ABC transporter ATP-binding protein [Clostridium sp. UBA1652]|uniref:ABC transporter ATP-binding protein n=1 Tax=Clostridium sp. UBA1652 TaxID=1946348 RepID=UPI002579DABC|nr:ABC transporter ATP-binding protein [Clostridium sp. UBA1652]
MCVALKVNNLKKSYGDFQVLKSIDFDVNEGEIFGILGPNGAGKTTTLECIEGIKSFDSGIIEVFGKDIRKDTSCENLIGVQLQSTSLQEDITVLEAMKFFCKWRKLETRVDLLDKFGLKEQYKNRYGNLSTGQKRRLHLSLAIANNPKLLILDEPTAGLDVEGRVALHEEIRKLKEEGVTIILASHDMAEVEALCDRLVIIVKGEVRALGNSRDIVTEGKKEKKIAVSTINNSLLKYTRFKNSSIVDKTKYSVTLLSENLTEAISEVVDIVKAEKDFLVDLKVESLSLEERFIELINIKKEVH